MLKWVKDFICTYFGLCVVLETERTTVSLCNSFSDDVDLFFVGFEIARIGVNKTVY